jgi:hypothetical protein
VDYEPNTFDDLVNTALTEGYILEHRGLLPPDVEGLSAHYAQLIKLDEPTEPVPVDPVQALQSVKEFCKNTPADICVNSCPLYGWCQRYTGATDPAEWDLPEVAT